MPKRSSIPRLEPEHGIPRTANNTAVNAETVVAEGLPQIKNPAAVELGRLGGKKGGVARASALSPERRKQIAQKAAMVRWKSIHD
jgi:hypothetical protein